MYIYVLLLPCSSIVLYLHIYAILALLSPAFPIAVLYCFSTVAEARILSSIEDRVTGNPARTGEVEKWKLGGKQRQRWRRGDRGRHCV